VGCGTTVTPDRIYLGIPVPPLFMATNQGEDIQAQWEVVDGLQRLLTLVNFAGNSETRATAKLDENPLRLVKLEKLNSSSIPTFLTCLRTSAQHLKIVH
jgi:hypothetical protein